MKKKDKSIVSKNWVTVYSSKDERRFLFFATIVMVFIAVILNFITS